MATVRKYRDRWVADFRDQHGRRRIETPEGPFETMALEKRAAADVPYGVVYGLDVLHAATCETRRSSLRKLVQLGDPAALPYLEKAQARAKAKLFGDFCLGSDLDHAIATLRAGTERRAQKM